jgi:hypothetical protein
VITNLASGSTSFGPNSLLPGTVTLST